MKNIAVLVADNAVASNVTGVIDFFNYCNTYWRQTQQQVNGQPVEDLFQCQCVSPSGEAITTSSSIMIAATDAEYLQTADAVVIASGFFYEAEGFERYVADIASLFAPLLECAKRGVPVGSFCSGTFVLAATGLLDGKEATSAWWLSELLAKRFPQVTVVLDKLVIEQGNILTAGATTAYLSLCLKLVERLVGEQLSNQMAKIVLVDVNRSSQMPFMSLQLLGRHSDQRIGKVQQWMQDHLSESWSLDDLATRFALSKRTLIRRFKQAVGDTPGNYLQRLRVEQAKILLETTSNSVEDIVGQVGYGDVSSFRKLFVDLTQVTPKVYRQRFNSAFG